MKDYIYKKIKHDVLTFIAFCGIVIPFLVCVIAATLSLHHIVLFSNVVFVHLIVLIAVSIFIVGVFRE